MKVSLFQKFNERLEPSDGVPMEPLDDIPTTRMEVVVVAEVFVFIVEVVVVAAAVYLYPTRVDTESSNAPSPYKRRTYQDGLSSMAWEHYHRYGAVRRAGVAGGGVSLSILDLRLISSARSSFTTEST